MEESVGRKRAKRLEKELGNGGRWGGMKRCWTAAKEERRGGET